MIIISTGSRILAERPKVSRVEDVVGIYRIKVIGELRTIGVRERMHYYVDPVEFGPLHRISQEQLRVT